MEEKEKNSTGVSTHNVVAPRTQPPIKRRSSRRRLVIACAATAVVVFLTSAGALSGAFLLGRNYNANTIDQKRQTVVQEGEVIADVAQTVGPSVVSIITEQQATVNGYYGAQKQTSQAAGTGLIIDSSGLILTNKHVVPEGTSSVQVVTADGTVYKDAQIIGRDPLNDIAIIKVSNPKDFMAATLGNSDNVRTGQKVIAIGNALGQFQNTVTSGIISGQGRPVEAGTESGGASEQLTNLFQTDAAINSGNSGGPLLNFNGEVIGINTAIAADAQNIGFAIPINEAKGVVESAKASGTVSRPYIGVKYNSLTSEIAKQLNISITKGAYISTDPGSVVSGSPADKAGLRGGDVITKVNNTELSSSTSLTSAVGRLKVGESVTLTVIRDGKTQQIKVTLAEAPTS